MGVRLGWVGMGGKREVGGEYKRRNKNNIWEVGIYKNVLNILNYLASPCGLLPPPLGSGHKTRGSSCQVGLSGLSLEEKPKEKERGEGEGRLVMVYIKVYNSKFEIKTQHNTTQPSTSTAPLPLLGGQSRH